jgi:MoxR-like ATPase
MSPIDIPALQEKVRDESQFVDRLVGEVNKVIVGQRYMIERLLIGLLTNGHVLLEGVPGLAKTLTVRTLARAIRSRFQRIQFTPDLLPADLIGTLIYDQREQVFRPRKGPIFANLILADEINRAPAKVQSALLEAMQEHQVTIGDASFPLDEPFLGLATQNPIEQEGTYPLPEAQVDRFMLKLRIGYPSVEDERMILDRMAFAALEDRERAEESVLPVIEPEEILSARRIVDTVYMDEKVKNYVIDVVMATREPKKRGVRFLSTGNGSGGGEVEVTNAIQYGASPRATIALTLAAKAHAFLRHRGHVTPDDVKAIGLDVLRHRVILTYEAEAENLTSDDVIRQVFDQVEVP